MASYKNNTSFLVFVAFLMNCQCLDAEITPFFTYLMMHRIRCFFGNRVCVSVRKIKILVVQTCNETLKAS